MGTDKLVYVGKDRAGRKRYRLKDDENVVLVEEDGKLIPGRVIDGGANIMFFDGEKLFYDRDYYTFVGLGTSNGYKIKVLEVASIPYIDRFGLYLFGQLLREASKDMPFTFVDNPEEADIIHIHQVGPIKIPDEFFGKKIILHFHGFKPENFDEYKHLVDELVFVSDYQRRALFSCVSGRVVWNGVIPAEALSRTDYYHFLFAQANYDAKNVDWIKENIRKFPHFEVATAGRIEIDGADNYGYLPMELLHYLHAASLIFVMPSKREAFGLAPLYAMLQGTAPAVSWHSGIAEVLPDDISIKFYPEDATLEDIWKEYKQKKLYYKLNMIVEHTKNFYPHKWAETMTDVILKVSEK